ncbi:oligosaccharide flippase family protein [Metabacillus idriensis]|uniref:lipopolysaccharide biosynthesis protein n=1 Tax=Metabacillus idriensis TaxID=324768 RepID=UPI00203FC2F5|nr:oligosaccharide flippase family protein [Metabacillus idriensis]MCM3597510.1 oligosaccharide flippase family protein [Metabacillus idriensis]
MAKNNLLKKFLEFALGSGIVLLLGFISSPINTRLFSPEEFGKFSMFNLFTNILVTIILFGLDQSFVRYFYEEHVKNRPLLLRKTLNISLLICLFTSIIIFFFHNQIFEILFNEMSIQLLTLIIINNFLFLLYKYVILVIRMQQRGKVFSYLQITQKLSNIIITVLFFLFLKNDFIVLIYASVISNFIIVCWGIVLEKKFWFKSRSEGAIKTSDKELFNYGFPLLFTFLITWIFQAGDRIFIRHYSGLEELGIYAAAFSIVALISAVQGAFTTFWLPVAYERYKDNPEDKKFFENVSKLVAFSMLLIAILLIISKDLIVVILGEEFRSASYIMPFLVFMPVLYTVSETTVLGINFNKKSKFHFYIAILCATINIISNICLVPIYGAVGAAISTAITYIVFFALRTIISIKLYQNRYGLLKFGICIINVLVFAYTASFYNAYILNILLGLFNLIVLFILYHEEVNKIFNLIRKKVFK